MLHPRAWSAHVARFAVVLCLGVAPAQAATYYVSPQGQDANDGRSPEKAWKSAARVNATPFAPGDQVLFARGGEWRESLLASSSGAADRPIVYGAYGTGAKPRFWGSDVIPNAAFVPHQGNTYRWPCPKRVASVLVDHRFLLAGDLGTVLARPDTWFWDGQALFVNLGGRDPRADNKLYTACVRVDCVHSNGKNHLVFKELVGDESADPRDGYAFRVMGSDDVRLQDCEAYRAGRHHFGTINSTRFVGKNLFCAHAMPRIPGGATFYVSFSDASRKGDTHAWIDCAADHFENPGERRYGVFYDHGEGLGAVLLENLTARGAILSIDSTAERPITVRGGRLDDGVLEIFGSHARIDGLTLTGNAAVDNYGSDCVFQNMRLLNIKPVNGGFTGYGSAVVFRDGAKRNSVRFNTVVIDPAAPAAPCLTLLGKGSGTQCYGNILLGRRVLKSTAGTLDAADLALSNWNFYRPDAVFVDRGDKEIDLASWKTMKFDAHSRAGDPLFVNSAAGDVTLKATSPARGFVEAPAGQRPATDCAGVPRAGPACAAGAHESARPAP